MDEEKMTTSPGGDTATEILNPTPPSEEKKEMELLDLPDEVILKLLSFLARPVLAANTALVCKRFNTLSMDPSLWTRLTLPFDTMGEANKLGLDRALALLDRCSQHLKSITLEQRYDAERIGLNALKRCPKLEEIKYKQSGSPTSVVKRIRTEQFFLAFADAMNLRTVDLAGEMTRPQMEIFAGCLGRSLTAISVRVSCNVTGRILSSIAAKCPDLTSLKWMNNVLKDYDDDDDVRLDVFTDKLKTLELECWSMSSEAFRDFGKGRKLESLILHNPLNLDGRGMDSISTLSGLTTLSLLGCPGITNEDVIGAFLCGKLRDLTSLRLTSCANLEDSGLMFVASNCPELRLLDLTGCVKVTDKAVRHVVRKCWCLEEVVGLAEVDLAREEAWREGGLAMMRGEAPEGDW